MDKLTTSPIFRIVAAQFIATILASAMCLLFDRVAATSALLAGLACVIPGCYTLMVSLRPVAKGNPGISLVLRGELGKFALTMSMFAMTFVFVKPLNILVFFGTFFGLQLCVVGVLWYQARRLLRR